MSRSIYRPCGESIWDVLAHVRSLSLHVILALRPCSVAVSQLQMDLTGWITVIHALNAEGGEAGRQMCGRCSLPLEEQSEEKRRETLGLQRPPNKMLLRPCCTSFLPLLPLRNRFISSQDRLAPTWPPLSL